MPDLDTSDINVTAFSPEEFRARPLYRADVFAPRISPEKILGNYRVDAPIRCGIKDCVESHDHGYLVLMADGLETNTGWDCGLDHFGMTFIAMRKVYDRAERELPHRQALRERISQIDRFRERAAVLQAQKHGGEWLATNLRLFAEHYPKPVTETLRKHAGLGQVVVFESLIHASAFETADTADAGGAIQDSREPVGTILGIKIFKLDLDQWPLFELEKKLDEFKLVDAEHAPFEDVRRWAAWAHTLEATLAEFRVVLEEGKKFFTRRNLDLLPYLVEDRDVQEQLMWMVLGKEAHEPRIPVPKLEKPSVLQRLLRGLNS